MKWMIVTFRIPDELLTKLNEYVQKTGKSRSEVIRDAIIEYLSRRGAKDCEEAPRPKRDSSNGSRRVPIRLGARGMTLEYFTITKDVLSTMPEGVIQDLSNVSGFLQQHHNHLVHVPEPEALKRKMRGDKLILVLAKTLTEHGWKIVGCCAAERYGLSFAEIKYLCIDPAWRGQGISKELLRKTVEAAYKRWQPTALLATVNCGNEPALRSLTRMGFTPILRRINKYGHPVYVLVL